MTLYSTIILTPEQFIKEVPKNFEVLDQAMFYENASDKLFNENKFLGLICLSVYLGKNVVITNAQHLITKKGNLVLANALTTRLPGTKLENYNFITIKNPMVKPDNLIKMLYEWGNTNGKVMTFEELHNYDFPNIQKIESEIKVTCGLLCDYVNPYHNIVKAHKTCAYGILYNDAVKMEDEYKKHILQKYEGQILTLDIDNKFGGEVVSIPMLGKNAHLTINTTIKSVLSGKIVEKFDQNINKVMLNEIDPTVKQNKKIEIVPDKKIDVDVVGWYVYAI